MPAMVCHWLLGKRVEEKARLMLKGHKFNEKSFYIGCQGPDIFFFSRRVALGKKNLQSYGYALHTDLPSKIFASLKKTLKTCGEEMYDDLLGYALGMCCHYAYDTAAHPYICCLERYMRENDPRGEEYTYHAAIESALDIIMLRYETEQIIADLRLRNCVKTDSQTNYAVALACENILRDVYGAEETKLAKKLVGDMRATFNMLDDPTGVWKPMVEKTERLFGNKKGSVSAFMRSVMEDSEYDYANINHDPWINIMDENESSQEDFFEITDRAEKRTLECMDFFVTTEGTEKDFSLFTQERSFSNNVREKYAKNN